MKNILIKKLSMAAIMLLVIASACTEQPSVEPVGNTDKPVVQAVQQPLLNRQVVQITEPVVSGNGPFVVKYDFGDGTGVTSLSTYTYPSLSVDKEYEIFVIATDTNNQSTRISLGKVTVLAAPFNPSNAAPNAQLTRPLNINGLALAVDGSNSSDKENSVLSYQWDFGDQSVVQTTKTASHSYAKSGTYILKLTVSDGQDSDTDAIAVVVEGTTTTAFELSNGAIGMLTTSGCSNCHYASNAAIANKTDLYFGQTGQYTALSIKAGIESYLGSDRSRFDKALVHPIAPSTHAGVEFSTQEDERQWQALVTGIWDELNPASVNNNPSVQISIDTQSNLNVALTAAGSVDSDGDTLSYLWNFNNEKWVTGLVATHEFASAGSKTITLLVADGKGGATQKDVTIDVVQANSPPTVNFNVSPNLLTVQLDGSISQDIDGDSLSYSWDFGDGRRSTLESPTHTYSIAGSYQVSLTVSDSINQPVSLSRTIMVDTTSNLVPTPNISVLSNVNDTISVSAQNSTDDGQIVSYVWDFNGEQIKDGMTAMHTFATSGTKVIRLTVQDERGATNSIAMTIVIADKAPTSMITVLAKDDLKVSFSSMGSIDPEGKGLTYNWNFGDNNTSTDASPIHTYVSEGAYTVSLEVTDEAQNTTRSEVGVMVSMQSVENRQPKAVITKTNLGNFTYEFKASDSSDPEASVLTYDWDFGNGQMSSLETNTISFAENAVYTVKLTVSDGELTGQATTVINTVPVIAGDPVEGERLYKQMCSSCHDSTDTSKPNMGMGQQEVTSNVLSPININQYLFNYADPDLVTKIDATMPALGASDTCVGQCAADIAAFMLTWQEVITNTQCSKPSDAMKFGPRQMRLLTVREYVNTVNDLFGYQVDVASLVGNSKIEGFSNQVDSSIDLARLDGFRAAANDVIEHAASQDFGNIRGIGACGNDCADAFVNDVGKRLFRRPLTTQEVADYRSMFDSPATDLDIQNNKEGMKLALKAAMTSVNFLFRSEVGQTKDQLQDFYDSLPTAYRTVGNVREEAPPYMGSYGFGQNNNSGEYAHNVRWGIRHTFTGTDLIRIRVRTNNPKLKIYISDRNNTGSSLHDLLDLNTGDDTPSVTNFKTFSFLVEGFTGEHGLVIHTPHDNQKRNIFVESIEFSQGEVMPKPAVPNIPNGAYGLSTYELASFLSYTYIGSTPDEALIAAADEGLVGDEIIKEQITRLLAKPESKEHFGYFIEEWIDVDPVLTKNKDMVLFPEYTETIRAAMVEELRHNFVDVLFDDTVPFAYLYQAGSTFLNEELANFYGISGVTGSDFRKVTSAERGGILLSGAFLAGHSNATESSIIIRGNQFRERLLCQHLPPFPSNVDLNALREQQESIVEQVKDRENGLIRNAHLEYINTDLDACGGCHYRVINSLGLGLEDYDAVGVLRTQYANGLSVDFTGHDAGSRDYHKSALYGYESIQTSNVMEKMDFEGGVALGNIMSTLPKAQHCALEKSFRYMMGTGPDEYNHDEPNANKLTNEEIEDNTCVMNDMASAMSQSGMNLKEAFIEFGLSDIVRFRKEGNRQ